MVVQPLVHVALLGEVACDAIVAEDRPRMLPDQDLGARAELLQGFVQILGPRLAVADLGAAQRQQLMLRL